jgi:hypothetical protein
VATTGPGRFRSGVLLGAMLFAPAAVLVLRGNLSINEALVRFGCAWVFAVVGTALVLSSLPAAAADGEPVPDGSVPQDHAPSPGHQGAAASAPQGAPVPALAQPAG